MTEELVRGTSFWCKKEKSSNKKEFTNSKILEKQACQMSKGRGQAIHPCLPFQSFPFMYLEDDFIQTEWHFIQGINFISYLGIKPMTLVLLMPSSTVWTTGTNFALTLNFCLRQAVNLPSVFSQNFSNKKLCLCLLW